MRKFEKLARFTLRSTPPVASSSIIAGGFVAQKPAPSGRQRFWMNFEILGEITDIETIAIGAAIRDLPRLQKLYGRGRWRKMKGTALVRLRSG